MNAQVLYLNLYCTQNNDCILLGVMLNMSACEALVMNISWKSVIIT